jgi:hypothetical protein
MNVSMSGAPGIIGFAPAVLAVKEIEFLVMILFEIDDETLDFGPPASLRSQSPPPT